MRGAWFSRCVCVLAILVTTTAMATTVPDEDPQPRAALEDEVTLASQREVPPRITITHLKLGSERAAPGFQQDIVEVTHRWWASSGRGDYGIGLGTRAYVMPPGAPIPLARDGSMPRTNYVTPVLSLGLRYQASNTALVYADAASSGIHDFGSADTLTTRVGFQLKTARPIWDVAYSGFGMRLAGDMRMNLRVRRGGAFSITLRQSF